MISIPDHPQLIADLSLPLYQRLETGKVKLEAKADMRRRGVKSPDFADALALAFACDDAEWGFGYDERGSLVGQMPADVFLPEPDGDEDDDRHWTEVL